MAAFIDTKKALDCVNYSILLNKFKKYSISGKNLSWIENYLTNRKQMVFANNIMSDTQNLACGVPCHPGGTGSKSCLFM